MASETTPVCGDTLREEGKGLRIAKKLNEIYYYQSHCLREEVSDLVQQAKREVCVSKHLSFGRWREVKTRPREEVSPSVNILLWEHEEAVDDYRLSTVPSCVCKQRWKIIPRSDVLVFVRMIQVASTRLA